MIKWKINVKLVLIIVVFIVAYLILSKEPIFFRISNALFTPGLISLLLGLCCHVRNGGFFKTFSKSQYRRYKDAILQSKKTGECDPNYPIMDFTEYCLDKYEKKWNSTPFYICAIPCLIISLLVAFLFC